MATHRPRFAVSFRPSSEVRKRLRLGAVVRAIVVQPLAPNTAVISVHGISTVAVSPLPLVRGQVLYAEVADIGEKVHLRLVPPSSAGEAGRSTTVAELARHLAEIGVDPTDKAIAIAAAMLGAELPITAKNFANVARLVDEAARTDVATLAAAAWVVRHERTACPDAVDAVRAALFEPPCLGELLHALDAALTSARNERTDTLARATRELVERIRKGGPFDWLRIARELVTERQQNDDPSFPDWLRVLAQAAADARPPLVETIKHMLAVITGIRLVCDAAAMPAEVRRPLHVPFARKHAIRTAFLEIVTPTGEAPTDRLPDQCTINAWAPLDEAVAVSCELSIRDGRAHARLIVAGGDAPQSTLEAAARWLENVLDEAGLHLDRLETAIGAPPDEAGLDRAVPAVGLDFRI